MFTRENALLPAVMLGIIGLILMLWVSTANAHEGGHLPNHSHGVALYPHAHPHAETTPTQDAALMLGALVLIYGPVAALTIYSRRVARAHGAKAVQS